MKLNWVMVCGFVLFVGDIRRMVCGGVVVVAVSCFCVCMGWEEVQVINIDQSSPIVIIPKYHLIAVTRSQPYILLFGMCYEVN